MHGDRAAREGARLDFATNLNPYGPCPAVSHAARHCDVHGYPDPQAVEVRRAWSRSLDVPMESLLFGNGATELLWSIVQAHLPRGASAVELAPTFSEFATAVRAREGVLRQVPADPCSLRHDLQEAAERCAGAALVYLCRPNNPTGFGFSHADLEQFAARVEPSVVVLDESFLSLSDRAADGRRALPRNVLRVRSLTKDHRLAGLRMGLLIGGPALLESVEACRPSWSTSAPAQAAATAAAQAEGWVYESWLRLREDRDQLAGRLRAQGWTVLPSETLFVLMEVADATQLTERLRARHGVAVRDATSFGLPHHIRIAVRPAADVDVLLDALASEAP